MPIEHAPRFGVDTASKTARGGPAGANGLLSHAATVYRDIRVGDPVVSTATLPASARWPRIGCGDSRRSRYHALRTVSPLVAADTLALSICGLITHAIVATLPLGPGVNAGVSLLLLLPLIFAFAASGHYSEIWAHPIVESRQMARVNALALLACAIGSFHTPALLVWCLVAVPVTVTVAPLPRMLVRHLLSKRRWWGYPTLVIGIGTGAIDAAEAIRNVPRSGLRPMVLTDPTGTCRSLDWLVVSDPTALASRLSRLGIRHAVVSLPQCCMSELKVLVDAYSGRIPHLIVLMDAETLPTLWGATRHAGRLTGLEVRNDLLIDVLQVGKRAVDAAAAAILLVLGAPFLLIIAVLVKWSSPGPVFYGHQRLGRDMRHFRAWKFRTMHADSDGLLKRHLERNPEARAEWERDQKLHDDPRVTRVGRFLRSFSLDELPQLWNVIAGEMSLVGPRPIVDDEVARYGDAIELYRTVKPGITGLWQVSGRSNVTYADRVRLDSFFVRNWSMWLDFYILAKTLLILLSRRGAY